MKHAGLAFLLLSFAGFTVPRLAFAQTTTTTNCRSNTRDSVDCTSTTAPSAEQVQEDRERQLREKAGTFIAGLRARQAERRAQQQERDAYAAQQEAEADAGRARLLAATLQAKLDSIQRVQPLELRVAPVTPTPATLRAKFDSAAAAEH